MRLFVAITLGDEVRGALARVQDKLRPMCDGVRWVAPELLHLTVKFLGDVPDAHVPDVAEGVRLAATESGSFAFEVAGCGCFPERGAVRVVWAGIGEPTGALLRCAGLVEDCMAELDFPREDRPLAAHITLGRVKEDRSGGRIRSHVGEASLAGVRQAVSSVTLMQSILSAHGPTYVPVDECRLGGG